MKYALIENDIVVQISMSPEPGWELVVDSVFAGFVRVDGSPGEFINPNPPRSENPVAKMKEVWSEAPAWIRGPYYHVFTSAPRLAARDLEAVGELLGSIEPTASIASHPERLEEFLAVVADIRQIDFSVRRSPGAVD